MQKLADVDEELILREVAQHVDGKDGKAQYDCGNAVVMGAGVDVGAAVRLKKLGHKFTDTEAHDDLRGGVTGATARQERAV